MSGMCRRLGMSAAAPSCSCSPTACALEMPSPSSQPDARTARERIENDWKTAFEMMRRSAGVLNADHPLVVMDDLFDALLAQVERLEQERDEYRQAAGAEAQLADEFQNALRHEKEAYGAAEARAVQAERERDEALNRLEKRIEDDAVYRVYDEALASAQAAEARAQRYREALTKIAGYSMVGDERTLHIDMQGWTRRALSADPLVCRDPNLCWGTGTCPRDPACNE